MELYDICVFCSSGITEVLYDCGIDPLKYMTDIPMHFALFTKQPVSINIPGNVRHIHNYAFSGSTELTDVTMGNGVRRIHTGAFANCRNLKTVIIPSSIITIEEDAFYACDKAQMKFEGSLKEFEEVLQTFQPRWNNNSNIDTVTCWDGVFKL